MCDSFAALTSLYRGCPKSKHLLPDENDTAGGHTRQKLAKPTTRQQPAAAGTRGKSNGKRRHATTESKKIPVNAVNAQLGVAAHGAGISKAQVNGGEAANKKPKKHNAMPKPPPVLQSGVLEQREDSKLAVDPVIEVDPCRQPTNNSLVVNNDIRTRQINLHAQLAALEADVCTTGDNLLPTEERVPVASTELMAASAGSHLDGICEFLTRQPHNTLATFLTREMFGNQQNTTIVRRAWEENFMCEAVGSERPCVNAASQTCFASKLCSNGVYDKGFALKEFYTEVEYARIQSDDWIWPEQRKQCILCIRNQVFAHFLNARCNNVGMSPVIVYSDIGNIVGKDGEYCVEDVFCSSQSRYEGMIVPLVIPSVADYKVVTVGGVRRVRQLLAKPEERCSSFFFCDAA